MDSMCLDGASSFAAMKNPMSDIMASENGDACDNDQGRQDCSASQPAPPPKMRPLSPLQSEMGNVLDRVNNLPDKFGKLMEDTVQEMNELVQRMQERIAEVGETAIMALGDRTEVSARIFESEVTGAKACDEEVRKLQSKLIDLTRKAAFLTDMDHDED